jgi:hypothetical protein
MKASEIYSLKEKFWGVLMILALLWLTICLPIVNDAREKIAKQFATAIPLNDIPVENTEDSNPLSNSVEEKSSGNSSILEEYLHHALESLAPGDPLLSHIDLHSYDTYIAFHGELLSPPPESLRS